MEGIEFRPCIHPKYALVSGMAALLITRTALSALDWLNIRTGIASLLFSGGVGFVASSLEFKEREDSIPKLRVPKMQDNELPEEWSEAECTRIRGLRAVSDGEILREAALCGSLKMVRWGLEKAFRNGCLDRSDYECAFEGPWPQYDNAPLDPDDPIGDLYRRSGQERFKAIAELLDEVHKAETDPESYAVPLALPHVDRRLLGSIARQNLRKLTIRREAREECITRFSAEHGIAEPEMREILEGLDFFNSGLFQFFQNHTPLPPGLELVGLLTHPIEEWDDNICALLRLHAHVKAKGLDDLHLDEIAKAKQPQLLEQLFTIATDKGWPLDVQEQQRLRAVAQEEIH